MYKNTGPKIIAMANVLAIITAILGLCLGALFGVITGTNSGALIGFLVGILITAFSCVAGWVGYLFLAGFGELIISNKEILDIIKGGSLNPELLFSDQSDELPDL